MLASLASRFAVPLLVWIAVFVGGAVAGYQFADAQGAAQLASLQQSYADQAAEAERQLRQELADANERGNHLAFDLAVFQKKQTTKTIEVIRYVPKVTSGRLCLTADAVRLLNGTDATADNDNGVSQASGVAAGAGSAFAASDGDIANWIVTAQQQCNGYVAQLNALTDWFKGTKND